MIFAVLAIFMSCTDFFSSSLARWAARDPDKLIPPVTAGNVDDLIAKTENNPDLSLAVLKKINDAAKGASPGDKAKLQNAALEAAVNAAGLGQAVLGTASSLTNIDLSNLDQAATDAKGIVLQAVGALSNLDATSQALIATLPDPGVYDSATRSYSDDFNNWAQNASADNLAMAAVVLIAGGISKIPDSSDPSQDPIGDYLTGLVNLTTNPDDNENSKSAENFALALAIGTTLADRVDDLSGPLQSVLQGLKLLTSSPGSGLPTSP